MRISKSQNPRVGISLSDSLCFENQYPCPVCRYGQLSGLFWVEAFSCSFCHHIFTTDRPQRHLRLEDAPQPLQWRWTGDRWISSRSMDSPHSRWVMRGLGLAFMVFPTALVGLAYYTFPPLPNQGGVPFPLVWTGLTGLAHGVMVGWFYLAYYQIPLGMIMRLQIRNLWQRTWGISV